MPRDIDALGRRGSGHDERLKSREAAKTGDPVEGMSDILLLIGTCCRIRVLRVPVLAGRALLLRQARRLGMFVLVELLLVFRRDLEIGVKRAGRRAVFRAEHFEPVDQTATVSRFREQARHPGRDVPQLTSLHPTVISLIVVNYRAL